MEVPKYQVRATYTEETITVYQAYRPAIGLPAARDNRFPDIWQRNRMTWIKPSFLWMMYRCGWATKDGQEVVLAVEITRAGFERALANAALSHFDAGVHRDHDTWKRELRRTPARVQWDPERSLRLGALSHRSLQLGLTGDAARRFAGGWATSITDVTALATEIHGLVRANQLDAAAALLPPERPYPAPDLAHLGA